MTDKPDPRVGTDLGPYRIEAVIGRGGMGVVYLAGDPRLGRRVALKVLAPALIDEASSRARFLRESQSAAAIDHPNIIPVYEAGEVEGVFFLAMRYVQGADLGSRIAAGPLEPGETVRLLGQIASALDAANEAGLVHRDVKPANILIASGKDPEGGDHAYLTDFGLTKHRGVESGLTAAGAFMGTLDYIAPEQIEGREVDGRTDQYSLACVAFECLTGQPPFPRETDIAIAMAHLHEAPPSASARRPVLPADADVVLARAMAKRPEDRYPSSEAFVAALRQALGVRLTEPHERPAAASRPSGVALGIGLFAVAAGLVAVLLFLQRGGVAGPSLSPSDSGLGIFPNTAEAALITRLPVTDQGGCARGSYAAQPSFEQANSEGTFGALDALASVACRLPAGSGAESVYLQLYATAEPGSTFIRDRIDDVAAQVRAVLPGDCALKNQAIGRWSNGDLLCYQRPEVERSWIYWTDAAQGLLGAASREDRSSADLYGWWAAAAPAIHDTALASHAPGATAGGETSELTIQEIRMIASIPAIFDPDCVRGDDALLPSQQGLMIKPRAHIACDMPGGAGPDQIDGWWLMAGSVVSGYDVWQAWIAEQRAIEAPCESDGPAWGTYSEGADLEGGYLCYLDTTTGDAVIAWGTGESPFAIFRMVDHGGDRRSLREWWLANRAKMVP